MKNVSPSLAASMLNQDSSSVLHPSSPEVMFTAPSFSGSASLPSGSSFSFKMAWSHWMCSSLHSGFCQTGFVSEAFAEQISFSHAAIKMDTSHYPCSSSLSPLGQCLQTPCISRVGMPQCTPIYPQTGIFGWAALWRLSIGHCLGLCGLASMWLMLVIIGFLLCTFCG